MLSRATMPMRYGATLWSMVFPLGMYAVAGIYLGRADDLPVVEAIGRGALWVAFVVWLAVFIAMIRHVANTVFRERTAKDFGGGALHRVTTPSGVRDGNIRRLCSLDPASRNEWRH